MAAGRKNFIFFLCLLDGVQFSTTFRYYCLMRVYEWLGLTVTIHGSAITFAKLPTLKRVSCNIAKCSTPLRIGNAGLDIYSGYDAKQPKNVSGYIRMKTEITGWQSGRRFLILPRHPTQISRLSKYMRLENLTLL